MQTQIRRNDVNFINKDKQLSHTQEKNMTYNLQTQQEDAPNFLEFLELKELALAKDQGLSKWAVIVARRAIWLCFHLLVLLFAYNLIFVTWAWKINKINTLLFV